MIKKLNELPDFIIEEILNNLEFGDQLELQYCTNQFSTILLAKIYERLNYFDLYEDVRYRKFRSWIPKFGKYVKQLEFPIFIDFHKVKQHFPNIEKLGVATGFHYKEFNSLHVMKYKLNHFTCILNEPFPDNLRFINIIESVKELVLVLESDTNYVLPTFELFSKLSLKTLKLSLRRTYSRLLLDINKKFPNIKELVLYVAYISEEDVLQTQFMNLIKLTIEFNLTILKGFSFSSFPKLKALQFTYEQPNNNTNYLFVVDNKLNSLVNISVNVPSMTLANCQTFQYLKYANLKLLKTFDNDSMIHLFSLPKLFKLVLRGKIFDNLFKDVRCNGQLNKLELEGRINLAHNFFNLLQGDMPYLVNLTLKSKYRFNKIFNSSVFQSAKVKCGIKLQFVNVLEREKEFIIWVKNQSKDTVITFNNPLVSATPNIKLFDSLFDLNNYYRDLQD